jgi:Ca-activated chloride channel family protein
MIDVSGSVSQREFDLQMQGTAEAILDPQVAEALLAEKAALALIQWSGASKQEVILPWTEMTRPEDVTGAAETLNRAARVWQHYSTALGSALERGGDYFAAAPACTRRVIDVSGDGRANEGPEVTVLRDRLVAEGYVINGIAIEGAETGLTAYFKTEVIGGPGAFVLTAANYDDYPRAIRRKLINEVTRPAS